MRLEQRHSPAARLTRTRTTVQSHHDDLLHHIGSGLSTPWSCCDFIEPDLSVTLDVNRKIVRCSAGVNSDGDSAIGLQEQRKVSQK